MAMIYFKRLVEDEAQKLFLTENQPHVTSCTSLFSVSQVESSLLELTVCKIIINKQL